MFNDTKGAIGIRKSKKHRQHNEQVKKHKDCRQNTTQKTYERATQAHLKYDRWEGKVESY